MADSFSTKRPGFNQFRAWFLEEVKVNTGQPENDPFRPWGAVGDERLRGRILESFLQLLENRFGFRPVLREEELKNHQGSIESIVIQIYHVFSTMCLVDHINEKVYKERESKLH